MSKRQKTDDGKSRGRIHPDHHGGDGDEEEQEEEDDVWNHRKVLELKQRVASKTAAHQQKREQESQSKQQKEHGIDAKAPLVHPTKQSSIVADDISIPQPQPQQPQSPSPPKQSSPKQQQQQQREWLTTRELMDQSEIFVPGLSACRSVDCFQKLNEIDEGTYGVVFRAKDKYSGQIVALKKVKLAVEKDGFPLTSLREIEILLTKKHPNVVDVKEIAIGSNLNSIFMVMEYMDHDLKSLLDSLGSRRFSQSEVKCLLLQLLGGVAFLHDNFVIHRDIKTSNLLFNHGGTLKLCDFGLARKFADPIEDSTLTPLVVTLWYRAPELLFGEKRYTAAIDMWSVGCVFAELLSKEPLFTGQSEIDQMDKIFKIIGTPSETNWPGIARLPYFKKFRFVVQPTNNLRRMFPPASFSGSGKETTPLSDSGFELLSRMLCYDPQQRITASEALQHSWFSEHPLPQRADMMPTFPSSNERSKSQRREDEDRRNEKELRKLFAKEHEMSSGNNGGAGGIIFHQ